MGELEGDEGIQERCLLVAEGARREGCELASARVGRGAHCSQQRTGRLHRCQEHRPLQGRHLPLLSVYPARTCVSNVQISARVSRRVVSAYPVSSFSLLCFSLALSSVFCYERLALFAGCLHVRLQYSIVSWKHEPRRFCIACLKPSRERADG